MRRILRLVWMSAGLLFTAWMWAGFQASGVPAEVFKSDVHVSVVSSETGWEFRGSSGSGRSGVIFLPGGMVEPAAYAPLLRQVAESGHRARLVFLPWRCACTESQIRELFRRIEEVIAAEPEVDWVLAGHSRGGMLASRFVHERQARLAGLVLIGTTHPRDFSLADLRIPVTKVYGTRDGIAPLSKMEENRDRLPAGTRWVAIEGGNHVQFGYYRHQLGDDAATISRETQQTAVAKAVESAMASGPVWETLFDGQSTKGWRTQTKAAFPGHAWTVEDGSLRSISTAPRVDLSTERTFRNFEWEFEWKIEPGVNSGVKYLVFGIRPNPATGKLDPEVPKALGFELQLADDERVEDVRAAASHGTGALYPFLAPHDLPKLPAGVWHRARVRVEGSRLEHWLDGVRVLEADLQSDSLRNAMASQTRADLPKPANVDEILANPERRYPLVLTHHGGNAWYRNLRIRELR